MKHFLRDFDGKGKLLGVCLLDDATPDERPEISYIEQADETAAQAELEMAQLPLAV